MSASLTIHFDNRNAFENPRLIAKFDNNDKVQEFEMRSSDDYGVIFEIKKPPKKHLLFKFIDASRDDLGEEDTLWREIVGKHLKSQTEFWSRSWNPFVYISAPRIPETESASTRMQDEPFLLGAYISDTMGRFALGASPLRSNGVWFGLFHPHAARVYVTGDFNDWQYPQATKADKSKFKELALYQGYFDVPNIWLAYIEEAEIGQAYKFYIEHQSIAGETVLNDVLTADPYTRFLGTDYERNDSIIVNPTAFEWHDHDYHTPQVSDLILYELHVHGFTHEHPHVEAAHQGTYTGIADMINMGYFEQLGITALSLLPLAEAPTPQGAEAMGYNTSLFMALERDFGTPDDFRNFVNTAHTHNLAVIADQVFNHAANAWNPLWKFILDHPHEYLRDEDGGLYFSGGSPWGNRISTERAETQAMLLDACKMMIVEYHVDGFRFDFTHSSLMNHGFLHYLADELKTLKPDVILIAENMPNESDLNRQGYDGFAQWCNAFHDTIKAMLREGEFENIDNHPEALGDIFYFSKGKFAAHTNNVVNYCESHDEHSVAHEVSFSTNLNTPQAKERKSRLGLFASMVALGQPMIYMGQEFAIDRPRNHVYFDFPENLDQHGFFQWASRLINLRKRYPGLRLDGFNPIEQGQFQWIVGSWLGDGVNKRVLGWRSTPNEHPYDNLVILLNFENHDVSVDVDFGCTGTWLRLASIDEVNDIAPDGNNHAGHETAIHLTDSSVIYDFVLQDSSAYIYKWDQG